MNISNISLIDVQESIFNISNLKICDEMIIRLDYNAYIIINVIMTIILFLNIRINFFGKIMKLLGLEKIPFDDNDFNRSMTLLLLWYNIYLFSIQFLLEPLVYVIKGIT